MASTLVADSGDKSPEYIAIQKTTVELITMFNLDPSTVSRKLFGASLIPSLTTKDADAMLEKVLNHVYGKAIKFYKFLNVVQELRDSNEVLKSIQRAFVGAIKSHISKSSGQCTNIQSGSSFISITRQPEFASKFYKHLKEAGCNPWMYSEDLHSGDLLSVTIYKTLDECKAVIPVVTKGYAQSIWCMREFYYATYHATSKKSTQIHSVVTEAGWEDEETGQWLDSMVKQWIMHPGVDPSDDTKMANIASDIAKSLGVSPKQNQGQKTSTEVNLTHENNVAASKKVTSPMPNPQDQRAHTDGDVEWGSKQFSQLRDLIWGVRDSYQGLAYGLGLPPSTVNTVKQSNHYNVEKCFDEILEKVLKNGLSRNKLAEVLESETMGYGQLAKKVRAANF